MAAARAKPADETPAEPVEVPPVAAPVEPAEVAEPAVEPEPVVPERSAFAAHAADWAIAVTKTVDKAQAELAKLDEGHADLSGHAPGYDDAPAHHHVRRVKGVLDDLTRELARVRAVAAELAQAIG